MKTNLLSFVVFLVATMSSVSTFCCSRLVPLEESKEPKLDTTKTLYEKQKINTTKGPKKKRATLEPKILQKNVRKTKNK